jgi:hypothetical protein
MAKNITERLDYVLHIDLVHKKLLLSIWHFENLNMAVDGNEVWIKDFTLDQINSKEVKSLSPGRIYYIEEARLFPKDKLLPVARMKMMPSWKPIQTALQLKAPDLNHNYFGIPQKADFNIIPFEAEKETYAQLVSISDFNNQVIETAASYRLEALTYTLVKPDLVLILGTPLLPLKGHNFWRHKNNLYPNGYYLEYPALENIITNSIDPDKEHWIIWQKDSSHTLIAKDQFVSLSISSYRKSLKLMLHE